MDTLSSLCAFLIALAPLTCRAADGSWIEQAGGNWSSSTNWSSDIVAGGPGSVATLNANWVSALHINLDTEVTLGRLFYRDSGEVNRDMYLRSGSGYGLTLAGGGVQNPPEIEAGTKSLFIEVPLAGSGGVLLRATSASSRVHVSASNKYSGPTLIAPGAGFVTVKSGGNLGFGTITVQDDGDVADNDLQLDHAAAIQPLGTLVVEANAKVNLNFSGTAISLGSLTIHGSPLGAGTYDATSHPNSFSGTGSVSVAGLGNGSWINVTDTAVSWTDPTMWAGGVIGYGVDMFADFQNGGLDHQVSKTVDLPVDIVIGQLLWRDSGNPNRDLTLSSSNASHLVMATSTGAPLIWSKNRSLSINVPISGNKGLNLQSDGGDSVNGVTLRSRNDYTGITTLLDGNGHTTVAYPGDFGNSDVVVNGNTSDAGVELVLQHSLALKPSSQLQIHSGALVQLDNASLFPGIADLSDIYVKSLTLGSSSLPSGIYSAATHPAYFTGTGEIVVQVPRQSFTSSIGTGPPANIHLSWKSIYGKVYDIWESTDLTTGSWEEIGTVAATPPDNEVAVTPTSAPAAFYRIRERSDYLPAVRAGVIAKIDSYIGNNYLNDQNTTPGDIRNGQFHNGDNMRFSECTPVLVWAYLQPDSLHYQDPAVLEAAIRSLDYMVRAQGINGGFNENHGWCGVPVRTNGKSSVTGFTLHALGAAIEMLADMPVMQPRLLELMDANGTGTNTTVRRTAWQSMLSQAMPYQFSGSGRGHAPNQDLCALMAVYKINDGYAALTNGSLLKSQVQIDALSNEIFHGQPSAASSRPEGKWFSSTGLLTEAGYGYYGYDGNYGAGVTMVYLGLLAPRDTTSASFLSTQYAETLQYFFVPDSAAKLGIFAENAIARRSTGDPMNTGMLPFALAHAWHPAMERLYEIAMPYFAAAPVENISISSPSHLQVGVWNYCEWLEMLADSVDTGYRVPAERPEAWTFTDVTLKTQVSKPASGAVTFYSEFWNDATTARRHTWNQAPETIPTLGLFP